MKILVFGPRDRYDVYRPPFADEMPVELVFRRPDQTYVQAAQENADARIIFVDAITDVGPDVMDQLPELKMIHSEGVGYNCIDCQAARERGIYVCNNKGCNAESVAEHTIMLMLMALRFGIPGHNAVIQGQQIQMKQKAIAAHAPGLFQCAVGLVGFGDTAQATARRLASLHGFYDYLVNQVNKLTENPTASIKPPKQDKVLPKYLTAEQSMDLLESTQYQSDFPERDYCMVVLFLNCGMRLSELVGMDLGDIDLEQRQIRLFGKGHKERMVYLNEACVEALQLYLAKRNTMEGLNPKEKAVFVTRRRKERISNRRVEQLVTGAMKAAGLKGFSTHKLRHTAATLMYQTGNVDILTLKQLLGHSSVGTTQIYTHLQEFQVRAAIEQNPLGTVTPEKARLDTTKRAAGENRGENNVDSMDVEKSTGPMEAFEGAANDGIRVDISSMTGDKETV